MNIIKTNGNDGIPFYLNVCFKKKSNTTNASQFAWAKRKRQVVDAIDGFSFFIFVFYSTSVTAIT